MIIKKYRKSSGAKYIFRFFQQILTFSVCVVFFAAAQAQSKQNSDGAGEDNILPAPLSLSLNGTDSFLTVSNSPSLNLTDSFTIETWIKSADYTASATIIDRFSQTLEQGGFGLRLRANAAIFTICPARGRCIDAASAATLVPNQWQHIAAVYEGGQMRVYINGRRSSGGRYIAGVSPPRAVSGTLTIGANSDTTQMFHGLLDEIRISSGARYNVNFSPAIQFESDSTAAGLWRFDGAATNDWTGNQNHALITGGITFSPDVPTAANSGFVITPTPNVGPSNTLYGVKTISATEVWAVGDHGPAGNCCFPKTPVSLRWDGSQWVDVPVPLPPGFSNGTLVAVDATSPTNVWAVGTVGSNFSLRVVLLRWNGAGWNIAAVVSDPTYPEYGISTIKSITVISENDVWLVGSQSGGYSWTLHWDGSSLQTVPSPNLDNGNDLADIDAINANDIWAVGAYMVIRWNGTAWLPVPNAPRSTYFRSVAAIAPNDVWAAGTITTCGPFEGCSSRDGLYHYDGSQWTVVPVPGLTGQLFLNDVSATASNNVWIAGMDNLKTYVAYFDGTVWQRVASQNTPVSDSDIDQLLSISTLNSNEVWTVGFAEDLLYTPQGNIFTKNNLALRRSATP